MCDILPQRRFSLAPVDHGSSLDKKREEILQRPVKIPSPPQTKLFEDCMNNMDEGYAIFFAFLSLNYILYTHGTCFISYISQALTHFKYILFRALFKT
jgi:hypothetical protein